MILEQAPQTTTQASKLIASGGVIAFRTDTFYGLGASPFNASAVHRIKRLKGREDNKPILIIISDREQIHRFIHMPSSIFNLLAEKFWPAPLTLIGRARAELPNEITAGTGTVGLRLPNDEEVRELVRACGGAMTATSANPAHQPPSQTAHDVENYFPNRIDLIVDSGPARADRPSTVVDATGIEPRLIREGKIEWAAISNFSRG